MLLHKFRKPRGWRAALTQDAKGENLSQDGGPWEYEKPIEIKADDGPRIGASSAEIIAGVEAKGYFLWPVADADAQGPKGEKRLADVIGAAVKVMRIATGEIAENLPDPGKEYARRDGLKGGKARAKFLSTKRRKEIAHRAA